MGRITDWKRNKLCLNKKLVRFITRLKNTSTTRQTVLKQRPGKKKKKIKTMGYINIYKYIYIYQKKKIRLFQRL